jgi:RES domain-containing protein
MRAAVTAWRIVMRGQADNAFDGEGARRYGGRWNRKGTAIVYTSSSLSLASLEMLVHLSPEIVLNNYVAISVVIPLKAIAELDSLPPDWARTPPQISTMQIGTDWVASGKSVALKVPTILVPGEYNYLLNPQHPDFKKLMLGKPMEFWFDARLLKGRG